MQTALNARNKGLRSPPARLERIIVGTQTFSEPVTPPAPWGQAACSVELSRANSPAEAYVAAFRAGIQGVRSGSLADSPDDLAQVAAAFRAAEREACRWVYRWAGWNGIQARELAQAFALGAGTWLMGGGGNFAALLLDLRIIWYDESERG
jgi:hypothetical protein